MVVDCSYALIDIIEQSTIVVPGGVDVDCQPASLFVAGRNADVIHGPYTILCMAASLTLSGMTANIYSPTGETHRQRRTIQWGQQIGR